MTGMLTSLEQRGQEEAQGRPVGDQNEREKQKEKEGEGRLVQGHDRPLEPRTGNEEIEPDRRRVVADAEIGKENDPEVNGVHLEPLGHGDDED